MEEGSSDGLRFKPVDNPTSTDTSPAFSLKDIPGVTFVDATPATVQSNDSAGSRRATQANDEAPEEKKHKNLVVCIDGTANQFGLKVRSISIATMSLALNPPRKNTNVVELYSRLVADETQLTYYDSGIGTYVAESNIFIRAMQWVVNTLDMAIAMCVNLCERWLCIG